MSFLLNQLSYEHVKHPNMTVQTLFFLVSKEFIDKTRNGQKIAIYKSQILGITLYLSWSLNFVTDFRTLLDEILYAAVI